MATNPYANLYRGPVQQSPWWKSTKPVRSSTSAGDFDPAKSAAQAASQIIAEMVASVKREQDAARQAAQLEASRELAKGQALAYGLKDMGIADQIQRIFQTAGQNQALLAQGFSGQIRDQASADAAAQQNTLRGTGQEGAVRNEGENMGNVAYGAGGYIPGNEMSALAAAFGANAALQPGFATQFGQLGEAERMRQWAQEQKGWGDKIAEAIGQKPGLFQELLAQNRSYASDLYSRKKDQRDFAYQTYKDKRDFEYQKLTDQLNVAIASQEMSLDQAKQALAEWEAQNPELEARTLANGQIQWFNPATGQPVGAPTGPTKKPPKPTTGPTSDKAQTAFSDAVGDSLKDITENAADVFAQLIADSAARVAVKEGFYQPQQYVSLAKARKFLMDKYWPLVKAKGGNKKMKARLFRQITASLRKAGFRFSTVKPEKPTTANNPPYPAR